MWAAGLPGSRGVGLPGQEENEDRATEKSLILFVGKTGIPGLPPRPLVPTPAYEQAYSENFVELFYDFHFKSPISPIPMTH